MQTIKKNKKKIGSWVCYKLYNEPKKKKTIILYVIIVLFPSPQSFYLTSYHLYPHLNIPNLTNIKKIV